MNKQITGSRETYNAPKVKEFEMGVRQVLCQSEGQKMYEKDYGDGGFGEL